MATKFSILPGTYITQSLRSLTPNITSKESYQNKQKRRQSPRETQCGCLIRKFSDRAFFLDIATYFSLAFSTYNYNCIYYTPDASKTQPIIQFATQTKFEGTILVRIAISPKVLNRLFRVTLQCPFGIFVSFFGSFQVKKNLFEVLENSAQSMLKKITQHRETSFWEG